MDYAACHVIYVERKAHGDRIVTNDAPPSVAASTHMSASSYFATVVEVDEVKTNMQAILAVFNQVYVCTTGASGSSKLAELNESSGPDLTPIIVFLGISAEEHLEGRGSLISHDLPSPSPTSDPRDPIDSFMTEDVYGMHLLRHIAMAIQNETSSKLIVPVAVINLPEGFKRISVTNLKGEPTSGGWFVSSDTATSSIREPSNAHLLSVEPSRMQRCLDAGAADVLSSPLQKERILGLTSHAYRARKEATKERSKLLTSRRMRKQSWVGYEGKSYSYLLEAMVSKLMDGICKPESVTDVVSHRELYILERRRELVVARAVGSWGFSAHDFSDDELQYAAFLMLKHALDMPELEKWRLPADDLMGFLAASRAAYNNFVIYHNFRHVVDVLQAVFTFLVQLGTLLPYPADQAPTRIARAPSAIATLLKPFDALTLLISAIGHDVGHPGVNNAFLVSLNAPLAQLYNDVSVLEAFHCAAYSQILRRYWKPAFEDRIMRKLLINSILATDMGVHFKYMSDLGNLQQKLHDNNNTTDGWSPQVLDEYRTLACGLLIKCADISNVARKYDVAAQWADILITEFANQGEMEKDYGIPTALFGGPPELGSLIKLANSQIGFMNIFARPLFEAVTDVFPAMQFTVDEILANKAVWEGKIEKEKQKGKEKELAKGGTLRLPLEGFHSPRSGSPIRPPQQQREVSQEGVVPTIQQPLSSSHVPVTQEPAGLWEDSQPSSQDLATHPGTGTPPESPDQSRLPSLGSPFTYTAPGYSSDMTSRRSSGAFPSANIIPSSQTRRSSNTVPSQLQLGMDTSFATSSAENVPPPHQPGESRASAESVHTSDVAAAAVSFNGTERSRVVGGGGGGGGGRGRRSSSVDTSPTKRESLRRLSNRHSNYPSSGRFSVPSSRDRFSQATSGANTNMSTMTPYSSSTQATSFLTVDSDENSYNSDYENGRPLFSGMPTLADVEGGGEHGENGNDSSVMTTVMSGETGRTIAKRPSRFHMNFWKKNKGKAHESSP
ncbi:MAG: 3',5'-cyclic-nucleotide phosphodiesterase [Pleopsidium flavum]|nr:MAG: 3',5'-cyclic-nucleotide phosphodiesterase [Pleopsidium flavum]